MPKLLILTDDADDYRALIEKENLRDLEFISQSTADCDVVFGKPDRIWDALALLPSLIWAQSTWAGVEPLLDPALRRDYTLTNARGVFGGSYEVTGTGTLDEDHGIDSFTVVSTKKYYSLGGASIMRDNDGELHYMLTDHLGSVVAITNSTGGVEYEQRYLPFGGVRELSTRVRTTSLLFALLGRQNAVKKRNLFLHDS